MWNRFQAPSSGNAITTYTIAQANHGDVKGEKKPHGFGRKFSGHCTPYSHRQHQEVGAGVASGVEFQFQTKAKHYPQSKTFPALKGPSI